MKRRHALFFTLAAISLLSSCASPTPSSIASISSEESQTSIQSSDPTSKKQSKWGGEAGEAIIDSFGWDIPYIENDGVVYESGTDAFKDPWVMLYVEFEGWKEDEELISDKMADFANICVKKGYTVTYETYSYMDENYVVYQFPIYYADIEKSDTVGFELQIVEGSKNGKEMMGVYAFTYPLYDSAHWPSIMVEKTIGTDVPSPDENGYEYYSQLSTFEDDGTPFCYIYAKGMYEEDVDTYVEKLKSSGWYVSLEEDEYEIPYYMACDSKYKYMMVFGYDYDNYVGTYFYIYKYPSWKPTV